jgi:Flp pilus assembly protein TadG
MMRRPASIWRRGLDAARQDERGVAAVEFAIILPVMLTLYLGVVELSKAYMASQRTTLVARTIADLVAQQAQQPQSPCAQVSGGVNIPDTCMSNIFGASSAIMAPYATTKLTMTVSQVVVTNKSDPTRTDCVGGCQAKTDWTVTNNGGTARPCQVLTPSNAAPVSTTTLPTGFTSSPSTTGNLIVADVTYQYIPGFSFQIYNWKVSKTFNMSQTQYMRPRSSTTLKYTGGIGTNCP